MKKISHKERVKRYSIVSVFVCILLFNKTEYPVWAYALTLSILLGGILYNLYRWKYKKDVQNGPRTELVREIMITIVAYLVLIFPSDFWFSISYFAICITVVLFSYLKKQMKYTKSISQ
ncbi:hypothetical protein SAMN05192533_103186 [Mesobacillus persicus]|uniref:Uncharacterized protein n=1 Tax=Mesobacillus persicus TaxID=930146 RepID=A0A1H7YXK1_9BACI|nr:hypothetical protein [Mesobacillus persicus]SEM50896.1 hypothetical protein SAMN05192533_103186 [Mesobacillus persicus]